MQHLFITKDLPVATKHEVNEPTMFIMPNDNTSLFGSTFRPLRFANNRPTAIPSYHCTTDINTKHDINT